MEDDDFGTLREDNHKIDIKLSKGLSCETIQRHHQQSSTLRVPTDSEIQ